MSYTKSQLIEFLKDKEVVCDAAISIGCQHDDRGYFHKFECNRYTTLDSDAEFKPDIQFNMNRPLSEDDGDINIEAVHFNAYDYAFAFELWEYIYDPVVTHRNIYDLLKSGGIYMGSYPFVYPKHNPPGTDFLRYTDDAIRKLLTVAKFTDIEITPRYSESSLTAFYGAEGMRMRKDVDHDIVGYIVKAKK